MNYIALILIVTLSFIGLPRQEESEAKEASKVQKVQNTMEVRKPIMVDGVEWTSRTFMLKKKLMKLGMEEDLAKVLINRCKGLSDDKNPRNCVFVGAMILKAESGMGKRYSKCHNIYSMILRSGPACFANRTKATEDFVERYSRLWYKSDKPIHFYSPYANVKPKTGYCASEVSSGSPNSCPNGYKISTIVYNALTES